MEQTLRAPKAAFWERCSENAAKPTVTNVDQPATIVDLFGMTMRLKNAGVSQPVDVTTVSQSVAVTAVSPSADTTTVVNPSAGSILVATGVMDVHHNPKADAVCIRPPSCIAPEK